MPTAHVSALELYSSLSKISGLICRGVPTVSVLVYYNLPHLTANLANPKSETLTVILLCDFWIIKFASLISLWVLMRPTSLVNNDDISILCTICLASSSSSVLLIIFRLAWSIYSSRVQSNFSKIRYI